MKAVISIMGKKYEGEGETPLEAIRNIPYKGFPRLKSILVVGNKEVILSAMQTQRLFAPNPMMREVNTKSISLRF